MLRNFSQTSGLDIVMQRKVKNPLTGIVWVNDSPDTVKRSSMDLVLARAEAANVPVHSVGYGKNQDPSGLWLISSHTHGTYTFVKEWYHLRGESEQGHIRSHHPLTGFRASDCLAGIVGGLTSIAITNMKIHLGAQDSKFKCRKVSGVPHAVLSKDGKDVDIELKEFRFGQRLEVLIEMELERNVTEEITSTQMDSSRPTSDESDDSTSRKHHGDPQHIHKSSSFTNDHDGDNRTRTGTDNLLQMSDDGLIDEVPVMDLDCSYSDPAAGRSVARLSHPILLTIAVLPAWHSGPAPIPDQAVARRKFELMASDSMTRALLLTSRQNWTQAQRILQEAAKILTAVINNAVSSLGNGTWVTGSKANLRKQIQARATAMSLQAVVGDLEFLLEGMEEQRELFERDPKHYGAQQALVLRTQKSWTTRTPTEKLYCAEGSREMIAASREWSSR